jgi:hypothetical protein
MIFNPRSDTLHSGLGIPVSDPSRYIRMSCTNSKIALRGYPGTDMNFFYLFTEGLKKQNQLNKTDHS